jgi:hypothetical protein
MFSGIVFAQDVRVIPSDEEITIFSGESGEVNLTVKNNQDQSDRFSISIFPSYWNKISASPEKNTLIIGANSESSTKIRFSSLIDAEKGTQLFSITAMSLTNSSIRDTETVKVKIQMKSPVYISNFTLGKRALDPGETLTVTTEVINIANTVSESYTLETTLEKDGKTIEKFENIVSSIEPGSSKSIVNTHTFDKYASPGGYFVESILKDSLDRVIDKESTTLQINVISKSPEEYTEKTTSIGIISTSIKIKVKNEGNVLTSEFYVTESIPAFAKTFFDPKTEPDITNETDDKIIYGWLVQPLDPGEEVVIKYKFQIWVIWATILAIAGIAYILLKVTLTPTITKKCKMISKKEILVSLEVKNGGMSKIKDVLIKDFTSSLTELVKKFDTLAPKTKKVKNRIELTWKLESLMPREERVLTYRVRPTVGVVGFLKLPPATLTYIDKKNRKRATKSSALTVKPSS